MTASSYPLRRPAIWAGRRRFGRWSLAIGVALVVAGLALVVLVLVREPSSSAPLLAFLVGGGIVAWGLVAIGVSAPARPHPPVLVNAVAVIPGPDRPVDDWVHLFPARRFGRTLSLGMLVLGGYLVVLAVGVTALVLLGEEDPVSVLFVGIPFAAGIAMLVLAGREVVSHRRLSTFGRAPTGLALGRSGLTVLDPGSTRVLPWSRVDGVRAANGRTRGGESSLYPELVISTGGERVVLPLARYAVEAEVVFGAVATACEVSAFREGLGSARVQAVFEEWAREVRSEGGSREG